MVPGRYVFGGAAPQRQLSFHQDGQNTGPALPLLFSPRLRVDSWLNAVAKAGVKVGHATCEQVVLHLGFGDSEPDMTSVLREKLLGHLTGGDQEQGGGVLWVR